MPAMAAKVKSAATTRRANPSLAAGGNGCQGDEVEASASRLHPPRADAVVASCSRCGSSLHRKSKCPTEILYHYLDLDGPVDLLSATARFTNIDRDVEATRGVRLRLPLLLGSISNFEITHQVCAFLSWKEIAFSLMNLNAEFRLALHRFFSSFLTSQGLWYRTGEGRIRFSAAASSSGLLRPLMPLAALRAVARHGHADFALSLHGLRGDNRCRVQTIDIEVPDRSTQPQDGHIVSAGTRWATQRLYRLMQGSEVLYSTVPGEALVMVTPMSDSGRCIIRRTVTAPHPWNFNCQPSEDATTMTRAPMLPTTLVDRRRKRRGKPIVTRLSGLAGSDFAVTTEAADDNPPWFPNVRIAVEYYVVDMQSTGFQEP